MVIFNTGGNRVDRRQNTGVLLNLYNKICYILSFMNDIRALKRLLSMSAIFIFLRKTKNSGVGMYILLQIYFSTNAIYILIVDT